MSRFASLVQSRMSSAAQQGTLVRNPVEEMNRGGGGDRFLAIGSQALNHLAGSNTLCAQDERCRAVWESMSVAYEQGSPADKRTALTRLQHLLRDLTAEDADVAADVRVQNLRHQLHLFLDH